MQILDFLRDILDKFQEKSTEIIATFLAGIVSFIVIKFKQLPRLIKRKTQRKVILHDWTRDSKIIGWIQDEVYDTGAIYGFVTQYHNHGPKKMTVLIECLGQTCGQCISKPCSASNGIRRLQQDWIDRIITPFWLNRVCLRTLKLDVNINVLNYEECDDLTKEIFNDAGIYQYREILIKTCSDGFITLGFCFCVRFKTPISVNSKMLALSNRLYKYF